MAEEMLDAVRNALEAPIDFDGQRLAEQLSTIIFSIATAVAFVVGFLTQNIHYTLWTGLAGSAVAFVAVVPPWPVYNKNNPKWLPARGGYVPQASHQIHIDGATIS